MRKIVETFIRQNKRLCYRLEDIFVPPPNPQFRETFIGTIPDGAIVADVGGGKKPMLGPEVASRSKITYEGLDYDAAELAAAPQGYYDTTEVVDITAPPESLFGRYDFIICRNTLEHVTDAPSAITGLSKMLTEGGQLYIKAPCRLALFAQLNVRLPEGLKRKILFFVSSSKSGDGFPAYYLGCDPGSMASNAMNAGLRVSRKAELNYRSSYFTLLLPIYLVWRLVTAGQYLLQRHYCESFEVVFEKPLPQKPMAVEAG